MAQAGGHGALTSVLVSQQFTVLTAAELRSPAQIAKWATATLYAYTSNPDFAKTQPLLTRGLGPGVGGTLALYDMETAYPANINPTSSAANMVNARVNHDIGWLTGLIARFGSNGVSDFLEELKKNVKWQEKAGGSEAKVLQFTAAMSELVAKTSPTVIASVDTKVLNEAVYALLPTALADIIKKMKPTTAGHIEDWKAIVKRLIEGAQAVEKFAALTSAMSPHKSTGRDRDDDWRGKYGSPFKRDRWDKGGKGKGKGKGGGKGENDSQLSNRESNATDTNEKGKKGGKGKNGGKGSKGGKGGKGNKKDLSHITCRNCNEVGHFADKCTKEKVVKND